MTNAKRNTVTYVLKDDHETIYIGQTNDPERREQEHIADGKKFTKMTITSPKLTEKSAIQKEQEALARYKKNQGKLPKYNKTKNG